MSEELIQRNLIEAPEKMGDWNFYNIGATTLKALKGAKIIPDKDYEAYEGKKPDALIVKKPIIIAAIEYKTPQELRTEKQIAKAIAQEIGTAQILQAKVYIVTDGKKTFWINPATGQEILQEDGSRITLNFDKSSTECITLINKILILDGKFSINGDRGILVPKNGRQDLDFDYMKFTLEPIFRELAKGRKGDNGEDEFTKLYPSMLSNIMVPIPVDGKGNISLLLQKEIAQKFISVQNSQKEIIEKLDALISKKISI